MPWQRQVADVGLELLSDGRPAYREVIISVPRQNGKTTLVLAWEIDRALMWGRRQRIIYSAQTGQDAREKLLEDQVPLLLESPFAGLISPPFGRVDRSKGGEAILFKGGSRISVVANTGAAGHGKTIGLGVVDEAFDDIDNRREQALVPAMRTVRDAQLIVCSTMGTEGSLYLNSKVDAGRAIAAEDSDSSRIAYFEWSAPDDADPGDPEAWAACTPALGYTLELDTIHAEYETNLKAGKLGEFQRFALNQRTLSDERVIPREAWDAVQSEQRVDAAKVVFAVDVDPDRSCAAITKAAAGQVELVEADSGTAWVVVRAAELAHRYHAALAVDPYGPAAAFIPQLRAEQVRLIEVGGQEFARACGGFYDAVADRKIRVRQDGRLDTAVAGAKRRPLGDAWVWSRKTSNVDITPLVAGTIAYWAAQQTPGPPKFFGAEELA